MSKPSRIQLSRRKGWRMPPNTIKVDRSTEFGNFVGQHWMLRPLTPWAREEATNEFRRWLKKYPAMIDLSKLRGKNLACWCPLDQPCHADVLLELANA